MRILDQFSDKRLRRGRLGSIEQDEFLDIIVHLIYFQGGQATRRVIMLKIYEMFKSQFSEHDFELLESQKPPKERWIHNVDWAKRKLVVQGLLFEPSKSPNGTWVLTEKGTTAVKRTKIE